MDRYTPQAKEALSLAVGVAEALNHGYVGTEHLLLAMIRDVDCVATRIMITLNINLQKIFQDIMAAAGFDPKEYQEELQDEAKGGRSMTEQ